MEIDFAFRFTSSRIRIVLFVVLRLASVDSRLFACASEWDIRKSVKEMTRFLLVTDIDALVG